MIDVPVVTPPFGRFADFLPVADHHALRDWAVGHQDRFETASVVDYATREDGGVVDPERRIALVTRDIGAAVAVLEAAIRVRQDEICAAAGYRGPRPTSYELEVAAHGHGAHFFPHLDIPTGETRRPLGATDTADRVVSLVYYFHLEPRGFEGGALRLFGPATAVSDCAVPPPGATDIDPLGNCLVAFPSWLVHEVRPVRCPSAAFEDYRLAVNCWLCADHG